MIFPTCLARNDPGIRNELHFGTGVNLRSVRQIHPLNQTVIRHIIRPFAHSVFFKKKEIFEQDLTRVLQVEPTKNREKKLGCMAFIHPRVYLSVLMMLSQMMLLCPVLNSNARLDREVRNSLKRHRRAHRQQNDRWSDE